MGTLRLGGLAVVALCLPAQIQAEPAMSQAELPKYQAEITAPETKPYAEMRSGPSWQYEEVGRLKKGEIVLVVREENNWVAVKPPTGSKSWINHRFLDKFDPESPNRQNAVVAQNAVEVLVGSDTKSVPTRVFQVRLRRGTIVEIVGPKVKHENSTWYPITPPEGELRWIAKHQIKNEVKLPTAPPVSIAKIETPVQNPTELPGHPDSGRGKNPITSKPLVGSAPPNHSLWSKAEQLEQQGNFAEAERVYREILRDMQETNSDETHRLICDNRIQRCRDKSRLGTTPAESPFRPVSITRPPVTLQNPTVGINETLLPPVQTPVTPVIDSRLTNSGPGKLRRATFFIDNKQAFALENDRGQILFYLTAANGFSLDGYIGRHVELSGTPQVRGDIRGAQYMVASRASLVK